MKEPNRILFIDQEIFPYLSEETPIRFLNRQLPEYFQGKGYETRTFMPKFSTINERRNQLHEVIRLSGMNMIIDDADHPLLIKVASIQSARIQIYFIDNDDYFRRQSRDVPQIPEDEHADNDERCIFFARGAIETVKKLRWTPNIIYCSGWMAALAPLYLKKAYADTLFFTNAKIIISIDENTFTKPFSSQFAEKLLIDGMSQNDVRSIAGFPVGYEELMRLAIDYSDAIVVSSPVVNQRVLNYAQTSGKPLMTYKGEDPADYLAFCKSLFESEAEEEPKESEEN